MSIKSSKIIESTIQGGGVQRVQVVFMDNLAKEHKRQYDFPPDADVEKEILIRQTHIEQGLKDQDIELAIGKIESGESFDPQYASDAELKLKLQEREVEKQEEINKLLSEKDAINAAIGVIK